MALLQIAEPGMSTEPHQHRLAAGIDLGTTNSLVATVCTRIAPPCTRRIMFRDASRVRSRRTVASLTSKYSLISETVNVPRCSRSCAIRS